MNKKKVTIHDVAEYAGVSVATVSRILNNSSNVKKDTAATVLNAVQVLGYKSKRDAKNDVSRNPLILVVLPDIENPFYSVILDGIMSSCKSHEYKLMLYLSQDINNCYIDLISLIELTHASGVITLSPTENGDILNAIDAAAPVVQCAERCETSDLPFVSIDDYTAARVLVQHMIDRGKRNIGIINGPRQYKYARKRFEGYLDALNENNIKINPNYISHISNAQFESAFIVASRMLEFPIRPDAIFCASDIYAAAAVKAATIHNISIPNELGITGFDNTFISSMYTPTITTINQPRFEMGYTACEMLFERIFNPYCAHQHKYLNIELVLRDSL